MSFLNLFKKSPKGPNITVRVWINKAEKEKACTQMAKAENTLIFVTWSKVTYQHFQTVFRNENISNDVMMAKDVVPAMVTERNIVFLERHFDLDKEKKFLESVNVNKVLVLIALSDPLMSAFNADGIQKLMDRMGHQEGEYIEHAMINKSIERAMEKIKSGGLPEDCSIEMKEWMEGID